MTARQAKGTVAATDDWFVPVIYETQRLGPRAQARPRRAAEGRRAGVAPSL
jgi:hypothetical protein